MKSHFWDRLRRFILVNPRTMNIVIKNVSFVTCKGILKKRVTSLLWKKSCCYEYTIFFFFLGVRRTQTLSLPIFPIFFKWQSICISSNTRLLLRELHSTNSLKVSWLNFDESPDLDSSLNAVSPQQNFENQLGTVVINDALAIKATNFFSCFWSVFILPKLRQYYLTNMHFQFPHIWGMRS